MWSWLLQLWFFCGDSKPMLYYDGRKVHSPRIENLVGPNNLPSLSKPLGVYQSGLPACQVTPWMTLGNVGANAVGNAPRKRWKASNDGEPDRAPGRPVTRAGGARAGEGAPLIKGEAFKNGDPLQNSRPLPLPSVLSLFLSPSPLKLSGLNSVTYLHDRSLFQPTQGSSKTSHVCSSMEAQYHP